MIVDAFKIAVWLIERYDLQEQIINHINTEKNTDEALMIDPYTRYIVSFEKPYVTEQELLDKFVSATQPNDKFWEEAAEEMTQELLNEEE